MDGPDKAFKAEMSGRYKAGAYATSVPTERPRLQAIGERRPTIYDDMVASRVPMGGKTNKKRKSLKKNKSYKKK